MNRSLPRLVVTLTGILAVLVSVAPAGGSLRADRSTLTAAASTYGTVVFDGKGFALYAFTADRGGKSTCYGACAKAWPPFLAQRAPAAGKGTKAALLGTTRRRDGRLQVTYAGRPLYYYVGERQPRQILCQDVTEFGGRWLVVRPGGGLVTS